MNSYNSKKITGYLPNETPSWWRTFLLGFQHAITMFPATVLLPLLVGFDIGIVLFTTGLSTITALILSRITTGKFIPLFYGSSFTYTAALLTITHANFGIYAGDSVRLAQVGIIASGVFNIVIGVLIKLFGKKALDKILPPIITGTVALAIGVNLSGHALKLAFYNDTSEVSNKFIFVAAITLFSTIFYSYYLKGRGFFGLLPVLFGAVTGYLASYCMGMINISLLYKTDWIQIPLFTFPDFKNQRIIEVIFGIGIVSVATIPQSIARLYQISIYVDRLADEKSKPRYNLENHASINMMLDGMSDFLNGLLGGVGSTEYGENNALMGVTRNYSGPVLIVAGLFAILFSFIGKLQGLIMTIPACVSGGLSIYLFGVVAMQGITILQERAVDLFEPKELAIGSVVLTISIGGQIISGGSIPVIIQGIFPNGIPAIAAGALCGIFINVIFLVFPNKSSSKKLKG